jgi:hypothetical protein
MPIQTILQKLEEVRHDFETWDTHYRLEAHISGDGIQHTLAEKFPGASQQKPVEIKSVFSFPDTEEGRELLKAVERFFETDTPVKIPAAYIKSLEYSDFLQYIYPAVTKDGVLLLGSIPNPKPLLLRCEVINDDGNHFILDYLHLTCIQVGMKEATLANQDQPIPIKIQLVLRADTTVASFYMALDHDIPLNAHQLLMQMQLIRCFSKPHLVRFTNLETGLLASSSRSDIGVCDPPDSDFMEAITALDALQLKSGRLVSLPNRDLTNEEYQDIHMLRALFRTGKLDVTWSSSSASIAITDDNREETRQMLKQFEKGKSTSITFWQEEHFLLFGKEYPLGPTNPVVLSARLTNESEVETFLNQGLLRKSKYL